MAKLTSSPKAYSWRRAAPFVVGAMAISVAVMLVSFAAGTPIAFEAESGALANGASVASITGQSGSGTVKFGAAATPTPSPTGFQANCYVSPHVCGYPDATNTGVPAGATLTNSGSVTVSTNGAVVQNLNITDGQIVVNANNVTIKNVKITGCTYYPIDYSGHTGLVIQDTEINSTCTDTTAGMSFDNYTAIRMNVHGTADGFKANSNVTIQDSYIHDLAVTASSHNDGTQSTGGNNVTLRHNTYDLKTQGVCVQFGSSDTGWLVTNNLFNCTGWMLNGSDGTANNTFTDNRFTRLNSAYGPASITGTGNVWTGNYYDDNGAAASL